MTSTSFLLLATEHWAANVPAAGRPNCSNVYRLPGNPSLPLPNSDRFATRSTGQPRQLSFPVLTLSPLPHAPLPASMGGANATSIAICFGAGQSPPPPTTLPLAARDETHSFPYGGRIRWSFLCGAAYRQIFPRAGVSHRQPLHVSSANLHTKHRDEFGACTLVVGATVMRTKHRSILTVPIRL